MICERERGGGGGGRGEMHGILEHGHPPKALRRVFDGVLQILQDGLLLYRFFDPPLCLHVKGIGVETRNLQFPLSLLIEPAGTQPPQ